MRTSVLQNGCDSNYDRFTRRGLLKGALGLAATLSLPALAAPAAPLTPTQEGERAARRLRLQLGLTDQHTPRERFQALAEHTSRSIPVTRKARPGDSGLLRWPRELVLITDADENPQEQRHQACRLLGRYLFTASPSFAEWRAAESDPALGSELQARADYSWEFGKAFAAAFLGS